MHYEFKLTLVPERPTLDRLPFERLNSKKLFDEPQKVIVQANWFQFCVKIYNSDNMLVKVFDYKTNSDDLYTSFFRPGVSTSEHCGYSRFGFSLSTNFFSKCTVKITDISPNEEPCLMRQVRTAGYASGGRTPVKHSKIFSTGEAYKLAPNDEIDVPLPNTFIAFDKHMIGKAKFVGAYTFMYNAKASAFKNRHLQEKTPLEIEDYLKSLAYSATHAKGQREIALQDPSHIYHKDEGVVCIEWYMLTDQERVARAKEIAYGTTVAQNQQPDIVRNAALFLCGTDGTKLTAAANLAIANSFLMKEKVRTTKVIAKTCKPIPIAPKSVIVTPASSVKEQEPSYDTLFEMDMIAMPPWCEQKGPAVEVAVPHRYAKRYAPY